MTNLNLLVHDGMLPKLWNRSDATARLAHEVDRAQKDKTYQFSILLVELRGLSHMTTRLGYAGGDDLWRHVLSTLRQDLGESDLCCRLGGDEFLLILPTKNQTEGRKACEGLEHRFTLGVGSVAEAPLELSIGMASYPADGSTVEGLLAAADGALHSSKLRNELRRPARALRRIPQ